MVGTYKPAKLRRARRTRAGIKARSARPRLTVHRTGKHIYAQIIDDLTGTTLCSAATLSKDLKPQVGSHGGNKTAANLVGKALAEKAKAMGVSQVVFDRGSFRFHGRVKALAEAAREAGLIF